MPSEDELARMDDFVRRMHTKSGLLAEIQASVVDLAAAEARTLAYVKQHVPVPGTAPLCGNSIGVDRRFLDRYMHELDTYLHYRSIDVSSLKELCRRWYPAIYHKRPGKSETHRALDDIHESIEELRYYREHLFICRRLLPRRLRDLARHPSRFGDRPVRPPPRRRARVLGPVERDVAARSSDSGSMAASGYTATPIAAVRPQPAGSSALHVRDALRGCRRPVAAASSTSGTGATMTNSSPPSRTTSSYPRVRSLQRLARTPTITASPVS